MAWKSKLTPIDPEYVNRLVDGLQPAEYVEHRLLRKIGRYKRLGAKNRRFYYCSSAIAIISAATVPVLISLDKMNWLAIALSLIVTIVVSLESLFHFREHWRNYDNAEEALRRHEFLFGTRSGIYQGKDDQEAYHLLVSKVEEIVQAERNATILMRTADQQATELADQVQAEIKKLKGR